MSAHGRRGKDTINSFLARAKREKIAGAKITEARRSPTRRAGLSAVALAKAEVASRAERGELRNRFEFFEKRSQNSKIEDFQGRF